METQMPRTHLIFDLDDTLYPERDYAIGGFRAAAVWARGELKAEVDADYMAHLLDTGHLGHLFAMTLKAAKPDYTAADLKAFIRAYGRQTPSLRLFDDAAAALAHWETRALLGLITDGHAPTQLAKISALALRPRFQEIIATGSLGPDRQFHKPHPRAFEMIQASIGTRGDRYVYIGDNLEKDFVAPNALGWKTVCIDRPAQRAHRIHKNKLAPPGGVPHETIHDLRQLEKLLV
jgi:putative hydrolase of the HAD superfamily